MAEPTVLAIPLVGPGIQCRPDAAREDAKLGSLRTSTPVRRHHRADPLHRGVLKIASAESRGHVLMEQGMAGIHHHSAHHLLWRTPINIIDNPRPWTSRPRWSARFPSRRLGGGVRLCAACSRRGDGVRQPTSTGLASPHDKMDRGARTSTQHPPMHNLSRRPPSHRSPWPESDHVGVIDLREMKAYRYSTRPWARSTSEEIPPTSGERRSTTTDIERSRRRPRAGATSSSIIVRREPTVAEIKAIGGHHHDDLFPVICGRRSRTGRRPCSTPGRLPALAPRLRAVANDPQTGAVTPSQYDARSPPFVFKIITPLRRQLAVSCALLRELKTSDTILTPQGQEGRIGRL